MVRARSCSLCTPAGLRVWGQLCVPCMSCSAGQERGLGCVPVQGCPAPAPCPTAALASRVVASVSGSLEATRRSVKTPVSAEPICVCSGSLFLTPGFGDAAPCCAPSAPHPALLLACLGASTQAALGHLGLSPVPLPAGNSAVPAQAVGETCSVPPSWGGKVCSCFASFPCLSPVYLHPWLQRWNVPGAATSGLSSGSCLLPVPQQAAPASQPSHSSSFPGKARAFYHGTQCAGVLLVELLGSTPSPGTGAGRNPARPWDLHHFPFLSPGSSLN